MFATQGHPLVGRYIRKMFNTGPFRGKVVGWWQAQAPSSNLFRVVYSDGDVEDLSMCEVLDCILSLQPPGENKDTDIAVEKWHENRNTRLRQA